jgi:hypothetical protein
MRAMLTGSDLEPKCWPYAFQHFIRLYNMNPHGSNTRSPYEICSGHEPDLRRLRTFGCRVYARPSRSSSRFPDKSDPGTRTGVFLGFCQTMRNIMYYDLTTKVVKDARDVMFDEGMNDVATDERPPNAKLMMASTGKRPLSPEDLWYDRPILDVSENPFGEPCTHKKSLYRGTFNGE